jgi:hypothetical protein
MDLNTHKRFSMVPRLQRDDRLMSQEKLKLGPKSKEIIENSVSSIENQPFLKKIQQEYLKSDIISQDVGISPIRSLSLTEKTAIDRIESLMKELEDTKKHLKTLQSREDIMKFKLPDHGIDHLSYYELITGLWRLIEAMQIHYNDIFQETIQKFKSKCELLEYRDLLLRKKLKKTQEIHINKLSEFQEKEKEYENSLKTMTGTIEKYEILKEDHRKLKIETSNFKAECKEKLKQAKADINIREELEESQKIIEALRKEKVEIKNDCETDKLEFLKKFQADKNEMIKKHLEEKAAMQEEINVLKAIRQPINRKPV